jgi:hypothetical protein
MSDTMTTGHQPMVAVDIDDRPWRDAALARPVEHDALPSTTRACLVRYEPGSHHPLHKHDVA